MPQEVCVLRNGKDQSAELEPCQGCGCPAWGGSLSPGGEQREQSCSWSVWGFFRVVSYTSTSCVFRLLTTYGPGWKPFILLCEINGLWTCISVDAHIRFSFGIQLIRCGHMD